MYRYSVIRFSAITSYSQRQARLAYDEQGNSSQSWLLPLTPKQQQQYATTVEDYKGWDDLESGIESSEAKAFREKVNASTPDQIHDLFETFKLLEQYAHGTHVAGIAARGNPAARLVVIRLPYGIDNLPFPPTEERARRLAADSQQVSEHLRTRKVRVVNMSWEILFKISSSCFQERQTRQIQQRGRSGLGLPNSITAGEKH